MTTKPKDKFWKLYLSTVIIFIVSLIVTLTVIFKTRSSENQAFANVLNADNSSVNEFEFVELPTIYKDSLSKGFEDWSWDTDVNLKSQVSSEHGKSIMLTYKKPNAGFMVHMPHFDTSKYYSIKFSIYISPEFKKPDPEQKFFIELTSSEGKRIGVQLLSWYTEAKYFVPGKWYNLTIPLENLDAENSQLGEISIISSTEGTIYLDNLVFSTKYLYNPKWVEEVPKEDTFLNVVPIELTDIFGSSTPYTSNFYFRPNDWESFGGNMQTASAKMRLDTGTSSNYGMFRLKGGKLWTDYKYTIFIDWAMGDSMNLLARYSEENFFSCSFFDDGKNMTLYQSQNGNLIELGSAPNFTKKRIYAWTKTENLGIEVKGDTVSCIVNGDIKLTKKAKKLPMPIQGGAGIELWSPKKGQSSVSINKVIVEQIK